MQHFVDGPFKGYKDFSHSIIIEQEKEHSLDSKSHSDVNELSHISKETKIKVSLSPIQK